MLGGDDQVAGERKLEPSSGRVTVDGRDHRLLELEHLGQAGESTRPEVLGVPGRRGLEVPAGGEEAPPGAGDDRDAEPVIRGEGSEMLPELPARPRIDRVRRRAIDGQLEDSVLATRLDRGHRRQPSRT